ncbi:ZIP family metal transporter [Terriglobus aquaticus]|uniref:ZIP family metal transporter n=1 Tax=Terriglobus aquaticus TaxID=940139 RepID=A0ABW9KS98_9BACT
MKTALLYSLIPVAAAVFAALAAIFLKGSGRLQSIVQHLASGVVFAAVALEITPDLMERHAPIPTAIGFIVAVLALLLLAKGEQGGDPRAGKGRLPRVYLCAIAIDLLLDGFVIGIGFLGGTRQGRLLTLALTLELVALGLALVGELQERSIPTWKSFGITAVISSLLILGTGIGVGLLSVAPAWAVTAALGFGEAALLYLVTEELLREAHEREDTSFTTATFFLGFLAILLADVVTR